jgi:4-hydroxy-tetrahydrodipicolinate synthase
MAKLSLIAAIGTPLSDGETLHLEGLEAHLSEQWRCGMTGVLVGGTMGAMQMLTGATYRDLVDGAIQFSRSSGEVMVGVGDTSLSRTRERIQFLNSKEVDAAVILTPFFLRFSQSELIGYFNCLADISRHPVFLYDLPGLTGTKIELQTVLQLAKHPNIRGIKCSGDVGLTRQLIDSVPSGFRVIVAQPDLVDVLLRHGVCEHLDGMFALAPAWASAIVKAADAKDWQSAAAAQRRLSALLRLLKQYGVLQTFTLILNAKGIPGSFMPAPIGKLTEPQIAEVLANPIVQDLLREPKCSASNLPTFSAHESEATK